MLGVNLGRKFSISAPRRSDEIEVNGGKGLVWADCVMVEPSAIFEILGGKLTAKLGGMGKFFVGGLFVRSMVKEDDGGRVGV